MKRTTKKQTAAAAVPYADAVRLALPCHRCHALPGEMCRNYKGQAKALCPTRGLDIPVGQEYARPDPDPDPDRPLRQGLLCEYLDREDADMPK